MGDNIKISYINSSKKYEEHYNEKFKFAQLIKVDKKGLTIKIPFTLSLLKKNIA